MDVGHRERVVSRDVEAFVLVLFATACFVGMTSTVKLLSAELSTPQIIWGRYATHFVIVLLLLRFDLAAVIEAPRPRVQITRSIFMFSATALAFLSVRYLPIADVAAIMFLTPVLVTALAALVLREIVGIRRWTAVAIGFLGALVIVRPGFEAVHVAMVAAIACSFCYALYQITTRLVADTAPPLVSLFYSCLTGTLVATLALPFFWTPIGVEGWLLMILAGGFGAVGHLAMIGALARAPASFVTPFTYSQLIWATIAGYALFGDLPDAWTFLGAALIAGSGLYVMHRERFRRVAAEN